jgi:integrase
MRKIPETITEEELIKLLGKTIEPHHKAAFILGFYQGMRVSEIVKLRPEDVDKGQRIIRIKQGKGGKDRHIPIIKPLKLNPTAVFDATRRIPMPCGVRALEIKFKALSKVVLQKVLHFHCLRHSGASWLLNKKKWDVRQVQVFLGHSRLQTTEIYTHVTPTDLVNLEWGDE